MCHQVTCKICGKATWTGCGRHQEQVLRGIPASQRCHCTAEEKKAARKNTFWGRLFG